MPTIDDFLAIPDPPTVWICDPYIARESITFLHGKTSIGKSPLTWEMARCVSLGTPFLGWQTSRTRVLYVEADTPGILLKPRLRALPEPHGDWWIECIQEWGLDLAQPGPRGITLLRALYDRAKPECVFWNTLRSLTRADLSKGETVQSVYQNLRACFPGSAHVLVHHNRKDSTNPDHLEVPEEAHSGSGGWRDTAQIVLHLRYRGDKSGNNYLVLEHTKTQGSPKMSPMRLDLSEDGTTWLHDTRRDAVRAAWAKACSDPSLTTQSQREQRVQSELSISRATLYRLLKDIDTGLVSS